MRDTILIAPDKFKGTLSATEVTDIIADTLREHTDLNLLRCPMADGGEGTPHILCGHKVIVSHDYIGRQCYGDTPVMHRSSYPLGEAVQQELALGKPFYIGIGGTATVDGGAGLLQALGAVFHYADGSVIRGRVTPAMLPSVSRIDLPENLRTLLAGRATLLYDVAATLHGPGLSTLDFARQKGATADDIPVICAGLVNLERLLQPARHAPCDGAGGGVGFALGAIAGADAEQGALAILRSKEIDWQRIALVISGEGRIDRQTAGGKVPQLLRREAEKRGIPFVGIGGYVTPDAAESCYISTIDDPRDFDPLAAPLRLRSALHKYFASHIIKIKANH